MTTASTAGPARTTRLGVFLISGIVLAALAEAIASTAFGLGRSDVIGDTHATPDEFAWPDVSYISLKLTGFVTAPWLMTRLGPLRTLLFSTCAVGVACAVAAMTSRLEFLIILRMMQGFAGGVLLVAGQAIIFLTYPRKQQPLLQAIFAIGAVVAPATIVPALQGWLVDSQSWSWIFYAALPVASRHRRAPHGWRSPGNDDCALPVRLARVFSSLPRVLLPDVCLQPGQPVELVR